MNSYYPFVNTPLLYAYDALEPFIDEKTMHLHHDRHLQTYIDNLNQLLKENPSIQNWPLEKLICNWRQLPGKLGISVRNNAGGVYNHRFFFNGMGNSQNHCNIEQAPVQIREQFHDIDTFRKEFKSAALSVFGSGYAWLVFERGKLKITTTSNQDTPLTRGQCPLLNIDVWEHAYYLKHYNDRAAYIDDWFYVIDWSVVRQRMQQIFFKKGRKRGLQNQKEGI